MNSTSLQRHLDQLEDELQILKWELVGFPLTRSIKKVTTSKHSSIIQATAGILGKRFPLGCQYEDSIRKSWRRCNGR